MPAPAIVAGAAPLAFNSPLVGKLSSLGTDYYEISSVNGGKLTVTVTASAAFSARVSLIDPTGATLVQSDASGSSAGQIDENVPAGNEYIAVQSLVGAGTYQITADLIPTQPAFQAVGSQFAGYAALGVGDFLGNGITDLVAPDGIHLGVGDGTFQSTVIDGPLGQSGWTVTAIAVGDFTITALRTSLSPKQALTRPPPNSACCRMTATVSSSQPVFDVDSLAAAARGVYPDPVAIEAIDFGGGTVDLAVADEATGNIAIFVGDGKAGFSTGPDLGGLDAPSAMVSGQFGDGHVDLIVADRGDPSTGSGQGLTVFQDDGPGEFRFAGTIAVGSGPSAVAAGDFTGNGVSDLAVADANSDDVSVLLNKGNGTFDAPEMFDVGGFLNQSWRSTSEMATSIWQPPPELRRRIGPPGQRRRHLPARAQV